MAYPVCLSAQGMHEAVKAGLGLLNVGSCQSELACVLLFLAVEQQNTGRLFLRSHASGVRVEKVALAATASCPMFGSIGREQTCIGNRKKREATWLPQSRTPFTHTCILGMCDFGSFRLLPLVRNGIGVTMFMQVTLGCSFSLNLSLIPRPTPPLRNSSFS